MGWTTQLSGFDCQGKICPFLCSVQFSSRAHTGSYGMCTCCLPEDEGRSMKLVHPLYLGSKFGMVQLYLHFPIRLLGVVLHQLRIKGIPLFSLILKRSPDHVAPLYPQELALTSPTSGGLSVGIVRSRTQAREFFISIFSLM
jgi:hypothetical protein